MSELSFIGQTVMESKHSLAFMAMDMEHYFPELITHEVKIRGQTFMVQIPSGFIQIQGSSDSSVYSKFLFPKSTRFGSKRGNFFIETPLGTTFHFPPAYTEIESVSVSGDAFLDVRLEYAFREGKGIIDACVNFQRRGGFAVLLETLTCVDRAHRDMKHEWTVYEKNAVVLQKKYEPRLIF